MTKLTFVDIFHLIITVSKNESLDNNPITVWTKSRHITSDCLSVVCHMASSHANKTPQKSVRIVLDLAWLHMVRREGGEYGGWQSIILSTVTKASDEMVCYDAYTLLGPREQGFAKCPHSSAKTSPDNTEEEIDRPTSNNQKPEPWKLVSIIYIPV